MDAPAFKKKRRPQGTSTTKQRSASPPPAASADPTDTTSETLEELIALRKLKRTIGGIDLERLNAGEKKRRAKVDPAAAAAESSGGMIEGTFGGLTKGKDRFREEQDDPDDVDAKTRRLVKNNNFTGQTNAVDVDKHMMEYIEAELRKRKPAGTAMEVEKEIRSLDPRDGLYKIAAKYKVEKQEVEEGNVALSAGMLTAIPEVDLGIDTRLKNIEDTEKAKRVLFEEKQKGKDEDDFAADRFYRARRPLESDADALAKARKAALGEQEEKKKIAGVGRRELATDDQVMDRFKKRSRK